MLNGLLPNYGPLIMAFEGINVELSSEMVKAKFLQSDLRDVDVGGDWTLLAKQRSRTRKGNNAANRTSSIICNCTTAKKKDTLNQTAPSYTANGNPQPKENQGRR